MQGAREQRRRRLYLPTLIAVLLMAAPSLLAQQASSDWQQKVRAYIKDQQLDQALALADQRLLQSPEDLEARGWRARLLAWKGRWVEAESEYRHVLEGAPTDTDMLAGLSDVLRWQGKRLEALSALDRARNVTPLLPEILLRRARLLRELERAPEARAEFQAVLALDPDNQEAKKGLAGLAPEPRHEFRVGQDVDTFSYTDSAQSESLTFSSRWNKRWSTTFATSFYQRFGEDATKFTASVAYRFRGKHWVSVGGAAANDNGVIPKSESFFEYGHAFRFANTWVRGLETSYQQHWFWYPGAHVLTVAVSQIYYLPKDWTWGLTLTGARSGFSGAGVEWVPSGSTKLGFPLHRQLTGNLLFALGSENFAQVDQIGRFRANTFGGGLRYRFAAKQDISGYVAVQNRSQGRAQNSFGLSYGVRF